MEDYEKRRELRDKFERVRAQLDRERTSFVPHWRDLSDYILPRRSRFFTSDTNRGDKRNQRIIDSTATMSARTLRSGMMSGVTSPARPWFRLTINDPDLANFQRVKEWLEIVTTRMQTQFVRSNLYNVLPTVYGDLGTFATGAVFMQEDAVDVFRFYPMPIGSFYISNNDKLKVDCFMREFRMTVRQLVEMFGERDGKGNIIWDNFSEAVHSFYMNGQKETWIDIVHGIMPNPNYKEGSIEPDERRYTSAYYEQGMVGYSGSNQRGGESNEKVLFIGGYDYFPVLAPRWEVTGEDTYGTDCPGMTALGDVRQLQKMESRSLMAIDKMINPPLMGPSSLRNQKVSLLPGDITYLDNRESSQGLRAVHEVRFDLNAAEAKNAQVRQRISRAFFEDLFLMLSRSDRRQITAREIEERHEEKLLALGPVLEQLNQDLLDPLIDNAFTIMEERGMFPPPPEEIQGQDLKVEYVSIMAQAQKLVGLGAVERFTGFAGNMAGLNQGVLDKIDFDKVVDIYGDLTGVPAGLVKGSDDVELIRQQRAQQQQMQQQQQQIKEAAALAEQVSNADLEGDNVLRQLIQGE